MSGNLTKSVAQQQEQKPATDRTFVKRIAGLAMAATAAAVLAIPIASAIDTQDKYSLKSPSGIAYSDFRGYEDWAVVSTRCV